MKKNINDLNIKQTRSKKWNKFNQCTLDNVYFWHTLNIWKFAMKCQIEVVENKNELGCKSKLTRVEKGFCMRWWLRKWCFNLFVREGSLFIFLYLSFNIVMPLVMLLVPLESPRWVWMHNILIYGGEVIKYWTNFYWNFI